MQNPTDAAVAELDRDWPNWQIWTVRRVAGGLLWCARRRDGSGPALHGHSSDELVEYLKAEVSR